MSDSPSDEQVTPRFVPLAFKRVPEDQMLSRSRAFQQSIARRRSVRHFSTDPIPAGVLDDCILAAASAPSGAHKQPWTFAIVTDPELKRRIRAAAESEEQLNYGGRMNPTWLRDLEPFGTDANKPFLEDAPALIVVFRQIWGGESDERSQHYYTQESVGIASGFLLAALHEAGLGTLTHTPSPLGFLADLLDRPVNEKAFLLIPVGYPSSDCLVPDLERRSLEEVRLVFE